MKLNLLEKLKEIWQKLVSKIKPLIADFTFLENIGKVSDISSPAEEPKFEETKPTRKKRSTRKRRTNARSTKRTNQRNGNKG